MSMTAPPTYREILMHLTEVSAMHFEGLPEGMIRDHGTRMLYQAFLACALVKPKLPAASSEPHDMRWLIMHNRTVDIRFGNTGIGIPDNGQSVGQLLANCLKFDPILRAFMIEAVAQEIIACDGVFDIPVMILIKHPPPWLGVEGDPWARLIEAGIEMGKRALTTESDNVVSECRRVLTAMLDEYEPQPEVIPEE